MKEMRYFFILMLFTTRALGQSGPVVQGHFDKDSISIGEVVRYHLTARYPEGMQVVFPDSTFSFKPFEFAGKKFAPTASRNGTSYDSVVYLLTTFETDSIQALALPVFAIQDSDSLELMAPADSVFLISHLPAAVDTVSIEKLPLKVNTAYQRVAWLFNYPLVGVAGVLLVVLMIILWLIFGKRIRQYFALRRLHRGYMEFLRQFHEKVDSLSKGFTSRSAEETLRVWKGYMEELEKFPYTKSTSREIIRNASDPGLGSALQTIDRGIYGGVNAPVDAFKVLESYSQQAFQKVEEKVKHG